MQVGGYFLALNLLYSKIWSQMLTIIGLIKVEQWGATKKARVGTLLVFQWLKLHAPKTGGLNAVPAALMLQLRALKPQLKIRIKTQYSQEN